MRISGLFLVPISKYLFDFFIWRKFSKIQQEREQEDGNWRHVLVTCSCVCVCVCNDSNRFCRPSWKLDSSRDRHHRIHHGRKKWIEWLDFLFFVHLLLISSISFRTGIHSLVAAIISIINVCSRHSVLHSVRKYATFPTDRRLRGRISLIIWSRMSYTSQRQMKERK